MRRVVSAVFFKEYVKTRACAAGLLVLNALCLGRVQLELHRLFLQEHPEIVWYRVMDLGRIPYASLTFLPVICGIVFCCFQFYPERRDERLRLSLHLPCGTAPLISAHLAYGLGFLILLFALDAAAVLFMLSRTFPAETRITALLTCLPWFLAGLYAYLCAAWCLLEPGRRARIPGLIMGVAVCAALTARHAPGALAPALPFFALGLPLLTAALLLPALHYRYRRVR